jgi:hypothetical protein
MSTGDQSQYVRAKLAERGSRAQAKFMTDGFDRWAESTEPAREGQMDKIPAEPQMASSGGAMTLSKAKQKLLKLQGLHELEGGISLDEIRAEVNKAVGYAKTIREFWQKASKFVDELEMDLKDEILANPKYNTNVNLVKTVEGFLQIINGFKVYKTTIDEFAKGMQALGLGKKRYGGAMSTSDLAAFAKKAIGWVTWLIKAAQNLRPILGLPSLQPVGKQVLEFLDPVLKLVGGTRRHGRRSSSPCEEKYCQCDDMKGRAAPVTMGPMRVMSNDDYYYDMQMKKKANSESPKIHYQDVNSPYIPMIQAQKFGGRRGRAAPVTMGPMRVMSNDDYYDMQMKKKANSESPKIHYQDVNSPYIPMIQAQKFGGRKRAARKVVVMDEPMLGGASCGGKKPSARGAIVKKVMREQGLSLPQASKYVKDHGLY